MPGSAVENPIYQPAMRDVLSIEADIVFPHDYTVVQTTFAHDYLDGEIVRLFIPSEYGMFQINKWIGDITLIAGSTDKFRIKLDCSSFDAFSIPATPKELAQVVAVGEITSELKCAMKNVLTDGHR